MAVGLAAGIRLVGLPSSNLPANGTPRNPVALWVVARALGGTPTLPPSLSPRGA